LNPITGVGKSVTTVTSLQNPQPSRIDSGRDWAKSSDTVDNKNNLFIIKILVME
jgi:hypothetical protein